MSLVAVSVIGAITDAWIVAWVSVIGGGSALWDVGVNVGVWLGAHGVVARLQEKMKVDFIILELSWKTTPALIGIDV